MPLFILKFFIPLSLCLGQGHVNFANIPSLFVNDPATDRFVSCNEGGRLVGTNWGAQLWYGMADGSGNALALTADPIAHFRPPGTLSPGTWIGGDRAMPGTAPGEILTFEVRIWDLNSGPDWLSSTGPRAASGTFNYTVPAANAPADAFVMYGFKGFAFTCVVPEPTTPALFALAGVLGWFYYRRKRK